MLADHGRRAGLSRSIRYRADHLNAHRKLCAADGLTDDEDAKIICTEQGSCGHATPYVTRITRTEELCLNMPTKEKPMRNTPISRLPRSGNMTPLKGGIFPQEKAGEQFVAEKSGSIGSLLLSEVSR